MNEEELKKKIAEAKHCSKPNAENAVVFYDKNGRWIFEVYTTGHSIKWNGQTSTSSESETK